MPSIVEYILNLKSNQFESGVTSAIGSTNALESAFEKVKGTALGFFGLYAGFEFISKSTEMFNEAAQASAQLDASLRSTANAANLNRKALDDQADALMHKSLYDDDAITKSQALLATFTQVKDKIYMEAIPAITDMATKMGGDLQGATIQVGKALNDPIKGITALQRVGVAFSETQKKTIAHMVEMNNVAGAQAMILRELQTEFGGSALAASQVGTGPMVVLQNEFNNVRESVGALVVAFVNDLRPQLEWFVGWAKDAVKWIGDHTGSIKALVVGWIAMRGAAMTLIPLMEGYAAASATAAVTTTELAVAETALLGPIGLVALAIGGLAAAYVYLGDSAERAKKAQKEQADEQYNDEKSALDASYNYLKEHGVKTTNLKKEISEKAIIQADADIKAAKERQAEIAKWQAPERNPYSEHGDGIVNAFWQKKDEAEKAAAQDLMNAEARKKAAKEYGVTPKAIPAAAGTKPSTATTKSQAVGSKSVTFNIHINDLVKTFIVNATTVKEAAGKVRNMISDSLMSSINDFQRTIPE